MNLATCHPDRPEYGGKGLCNACYQRERYATNQTLRDRVIARVKAWQRANHAGYIAQKVEYNRRRRATARYEREQVRREATSNRASIKVWWKKDSSELPKDWQISAKHTPRKHRAATRGSYRGRELRLERPSVLPVLPDGIRDVITAFDQRANKLLEGGASKVAS